MTGWTGLGAQAAAGGKELRWPGGSWLCTPSPRGAISPATLPGGTAGDGNPHRNLARRRGTRAGTPGSSGQPEAPPAGARTGGSLQRELSRDD